MDLKKTSLYQKHIENKAQVVDFGGWAMPLQYKSILQEAKACRSFCGLFDASHMGEIYIRGKAALPFLQRLTPNDISLAKKGQLQYNLFLNIRGGIIDDLMVYNLGESFLCVVNASNTEKVYSWLKENKTNDVDIIDESQNTFLLSLQGPGAYLLLQAVIEDINILKYMHHRQINLGGRKLLISRSGYTGEDGFEIYGLNKDACFIWDLLLEKGKHSGLTLCGLGARDILRIEAGYPLYGHEINDDINPLEATLGWVLKFNKDFIAKEKLIELKNKGLLRKRVGFIMQERAIARQGYDVYREGKTIGTVTSGTYSPNLDDFIGMAYIDIEYAKSENPIHIKIRDKLCKAKIMPFNFIGDKVKKGTFDKL
jgi:aminomethyltransferase